MYDGDVIHLRQSHSDVPGKYGQSRMIISQLESFSGLNHVRYKNVQQHGRFIAPVTFTVSYIPALRKSDFYMASTSFTLIYMYDLRREQVTSGSYR